MSEKRQQIIQHIMTLPKEAHEEMLSFLDYLDWKYNPTTQNKDQVETDEDFTKEVKQTTPWDNFKTKLFK